MTAGCNGLEVLLWHGDSSVEKRTIAFKLKRRCLSFLMSTVSQDREFSQCLLWKKRWQAHTEPKHSHRNPNICSSVQKKKRHRRDDEALRVYLQSSPRKAWTRSSKSTSSRSLPHFFLTYQGKILSNKAIRKKAASQWDP